MKTAEIKQLLKIQGALSCGEVAPYLRELLRYREGQEGCDHETDGDNPYGPDPFNFCPLCGKDLSQTQDVVKN